MRTRVPRASLRIRVLILGIAASLLVLLLVEPPGLSLASRGPGGLEPPEQEHRVGGVDEAGPRRCPTGSRHSFGHQEEAGGGENARNANDHYARREGTQAGEVS